MYRSFFAKPVYRNTLATFHVYFEHLPTNSNLIVNSVRAAVITLSISCFKTY
ncbi:unnamed protein product [Schistosoma curassoni]|uniref:Uncharacterized protein n=1 Tax=Schistosoma curassoni TaxID=6186 RepID=A0A183KFV5_9TREM|nr:unnamed protein product [Schistosoma curassoni]